MAYLNANIPPIYCKIRREYLYDLRKHHGETEDCVVFAIASIPGRAILFHALLTNGAIYWRLPISAFLQRRVGIDVHSPQMEHQDLEDLQLWNSFSYYPAITCFDFLVGQRCKYLNHSDDPSVNDDGIALKDIKIGDEITIDYRDFDDSIDKWLI